MKEVSKLRVNNENLATTVREEKFCERRMWIFNFNSFNLIRLFIIFNLRNITNFFKINLNTNIFDK